MEILNVVNEHEKKMEKFVSVLNSVNIYLL
jgi:hypothetical protein